MPSPESHPPQRRRNWRRYAVRYTIGLILYVLSIGPMYWVWFGAMHADGPAIVAAFYAPLLYACEINWIGELVNWYIRLWIL
jgi:hypothetical protein